MNAHTCFCDRCVARRVEDADKACPVAPGPRRSIASLEGDILDWANVWWASRRHPGDMPTGQIAQDTAYEGVLRDPNAGLARAVALLMKARDEASK